MSVKIKTTSRMNILYKIYTMFYCYWGESLLKDHPVTRTGRIDTTHENNKKSFYEATINTTIKKRTMKNTNRKGNRWMALKAGIMIHFCLQTEWMEKERTTVKLNWGTNTEPVMDCKNCDSGHEIGTKTATRRANGWIPPKQLANNKEWGAKGIIYPRQMEQTRMKKRTKTDAQLDTKISPRQLDNEKWWGMKESISPRQLARRRMVKRTKTGDKGTGYDNQLKSVKTQLQSPKQLDIENISPRQLARQRMVKRTKTGEKRTCYDNQLKSVKAQPQSPKQLDIENKIAPIQLENENMRFSRINVTLKCVCNPPNQLVPSPQYKNPGLISPNQLVPSPQYKTPGSTSPKQLDHDYKWGISARTRNNRIKTTNGNRGKALNIVQWNIGNTKWHNKILEIRQAVIDLQPDIFVVTEANLMKDIPIYQSNVQGYEIICPDTMETLDHCRIVILARESLEIEVLRDIMENDLATIWLKIRRKGKKNLIIGAIYRELRQLQPNQTQPNMSGMDNAQQERWNRIICQWIKASKLGVTIVTGDLNLDHLRWDSPPQRHRMMVDKMKESIETRGFQQIIDGHTRCWKGHKDSNLDHVWTDTPDMILSTRNIIRAFSDHNVVCANIRLRGLEQPNTIQIRRNMRNFSLQRYKDKLRQLNWQELYKLTNVDDACLWLESRLQQVLDSECPIGTVQTNKKLKSWISASTAEKFKIRDRCLEIARKSGQTEDWENYKYLRNVCTKNMRSDKKAHFEKLYKDIETNCDTGGLFRTTKQQLGHISGGPPKSLIVDGRQTNSPREMATAIQNAGIDKIRKLMSNLPAETDNPFRLLDIALDRWKPETR